MEQQELKTKVQEILKEDMKELMNGPVSTMLDIIQQVYERAFLKGMDVQRQFGSPFVSVNDRLPDIIEGKFYSRRVLVRYVNKRTGSIGYEPTNMFADGTLYRWRKETDPNFTVTHWMYVEDPMNDLIN